MIITQKQVNIEKDFIDLPRWNNLVGNLISQEGAGGELITDGDYYREYNALHQLTKIRKKTAIGAIVEEYWYGPNGERIMTVRVENGQNTTIYTPFKEWMMIVNSTGSYNYTYVYDGNTLVARVNPDGTKWFYHDDHLGSTSLITDQNGNVVEETFYYPFGQTTSGGKQEAYLLYTNQFKDAIGCYDYGARVYCPKWYHFTQADPITANVFDPQGLNRYAYVKNNPYVYVDPTGKKAKKSGAASGYGTGSAHANAVKAGRDAAKAASSGSSIYLVYSEQGLDGPVEITISSGSFDEFQEALKRYVEAYQNVYGDYITTNVNTEYLGSIEFVESDFEGLDPEIVDALVQDPYAQATATVLVGLENPVLGVTFGIGLIGKDFIAKAETGELEASDAGWAGLDVLSLTLGGPATKTALKKVFSELPESKVVDFVIGIGTSLGYEDAKSEIRETEDYNQEGDTNG